jgi:hypothetical protein
VTSEATNKAERSLKLAQRRLDVATAQYRTGVCSDDAYLRARKARDAALATYDGATGVTALAAERAAQWARDGS